LGLRGVSGGQADAARDNGALARSVCIWQGKLLDLREFSLTGGGDAEEVKRAAEAEEKEERRLRAAEAKTHLRVERRLLLSAFVSLDDWASNVRGAQEKLKGVASADRLAFVSMCVCGRLCVHAARRCQSRGRRWAISAKFANFHFLPHSQTFANLAEIR
jgi:hypothetical protein